MSIKNYRIHKWLGRNLATYRRAHRELEFQRIMLNLVERPKVISPIPGRPIWSER